MDNLKDAWEALYSGQSRPWRGTVNLSWLLFNNGERVLDAGCGNGKTSESLMDLGCEVSGIDFSESAIESCVKRFGDRAVFKVGDLRSIPFADGSFDSILSVHALEHVPKEDESLAISEFSRVLVSGGRLCLRMFARGDFRSDGKEEDVRNGILYRYHTLESLKGALSGWVIESMEYIEEPTRFGEVRRRIHCIARKV